MKREHVAVVVVGGVLLWWNMSNRFAKLEYSAKARKLGLANKVPAKYEKRARGLLKIYNRVVELGGFVTSAYRNAEVNAAVGGVANSEHTKCTALDVVFITREQFANDPILGLGLDEIVKYPDETPVRFHLSWEPEYLEMLADDDDA